MQDYGNLITVEELAAKSNAELFRSPNVGYKTVKALRELAESLK